MLCCYLIERNDSVCMYLLCKFLYSSWVCDVRILFFCGLDCEI